MRYIYDIFERIPQNAIHFCMWAILPTIFEFRLGLPLKNVLHKKDEFLLLIVIW